MPEASRILTSLLHPPPTDSIDFTYKMHLRYSRQPDRLQPPPGHRQHHLDRCSGHLVTSLLPAVSPPTSGSSSQSSRADPLKPDSYSVMLLRSLRWLSCHLYRIQSPAVVPSGCFMWPLLPLPGVPLPMVSLSFLNYSQLSRPPSSCRTHRVTETERRKQAILVQGDTR